MTFVLFRFEVKDRRVRFHQYVLPFFMCAWKTSVCSQWVAQGIEIPWNISPREKTLASISPRFSVLECLSPRIRSIIINEMFFSDICSNKEAETKVIVVRPKERRRGIARRRAFLCLAEQKENQSKNWSSSTESPETSTDFSLLSLSITMCAEDLFVVDKERLPEIVNFTFFPFKDLLCLQLASVLIWKAFEGPVKHRNCCRSVFLKRH